MGRIETKSLIPGTGKAPVTPPPPKPKPTAATDKNPTKDER
jgi:hypothetical protein